MWYVMLTGDSTVNLSVITEIAEYYQNQIGDAIPPRTPFVGERFNITQAGIHADGLMKDEEIYNIFDTTKILRRPPGVMITSRSPGEMSWKPLPLRGWPDFRATTPAWPSPPPSRPRAG